MKKHGLLLLLWLLPSLAFCHAQKTKDIAPDFEMFRCEQKVKEWEAWSATTTPKSVSDALAANNKALLLERDQLRQDYDTLKKRYDLDIYAAAIVLAAVALWRFRKAKITQMKKGIKLQIILVAQAAAVIALGISLMIATVSAFEPYNYMLGRFGGTGAVTMIAVKELLPPVLLRVAIASAVFWWLSQQKKLLQEKTTS